MQSGSSALIQQKILIVAHDPAREWLEIALTENQYDVHSASNGYAGLELFKAHAPDIVVSDMTLPELDGLRLLEVVKDFNREIAVIMMTDGEELSQIIHAMELGAYTCLERPVELCRLRESITRALRAKGRVDAPAKGERALPAADLSKTVVGKSAGMREVQRKMAMIASVDSNALIEGEHGTGKHLVSRLIHNSSRTKGHPFVTVDLPGLPQPLLESVLFGQPGGARHASAKGRKGLFELAGKGTLVLNGISGLPPEDQEKLLRVLQKKEFQPVGGKEPVPLKARVIATSTTSLAELVRAGTFREDLYYRVAPCSIIIPPLAERREDIPRLVIHLIRKINKQFRKNVKRISGDVLNFLKEAEWNGNVGELESVLMHAIICAEGEVILKENLSWQRSGKAGEGQTGLTLDEIKSEHIRGILESTGWNKKAAARLLNISRQSLYKKIKKYGIQPV